MTALCGGGPSDSRPGFNGGVYLGAQGIGLLLRTLVPEPVADAIAAIVSADALDLTTFCKTDPPPMPTPGPEDFVALLNPGDFVEYDRVRKLFIQWWEHIYWYQACQCTTVATPPLGPVSQPGPGGQNNALPSGGSGFCYETTAPYSATGVTSGHTTADLTAQLLPVTSDAINTSFPDQGFTVPVRAVRIPAGVTAVIARTVNGGATSPVGNNAHDGALAFFTSAGVNNGGQQIFSSQPGTIGSNLNGFPVPANATYFAVGVVNIADVSVAGKQMSWSVDIRFICPDSQLQSPCCPPDPQLELKIDQMFQLLVNLNRTTAVPPVTGWHDGTRHSGLRGAGSFLIDAQAVAIRWEATTPPQGVRVDPGNPDFYWDMGFWSPYVLTSPLRGGRLVFIKQTVQLPELTDQVGYTLRHDTVMDAIELLPTSS